MFRLHHLTRLGALAVAAAVMATPGVTAAQGQKIDEEYTRQIKQFLRDPRISTELVDHLPASNTVPTPLKFFGHIMGAWGELDKSGKMNDYLAAIAKAAPGRARYWTIGKTEEGRDMSVIVIGNEETIRNLEQYRQRTVALTDPRKTTEAQARQIIEKTGKPIYWVLSGMHSPERGGPQMLMELAYRLVVEETPFIQNIRNNVITMITPVVEPDGRDKMVDNYYFNKLRAPGDGTLPLMYWGKYVQHDNNRDGMGQMLALTKNLQKFELEWNPPIMHDLHEAQTLLYASTGTGPYNEQVDAITVNEWWTLAENDVIEMTKRSVPGVWTYGFYDGWTPNYMFFMAHTHNAMGRFYEVQSYGPDTSTVMTVQSREWFRPNPTIGPIPWGPRNNTNIQQSALLFALQHVAKNREFWLENYWMKNKRAVDKGRSGPTVGWVIPATQRRKADAADAVNELMLQGVEFHAANADFTAGNVSVRKGDYIIRGDQPFRTVADMYFAVQRFSTANPSPYDDTGWTFQYMRDIVIQPVGDKSLLTQPMTALKGPVTAPGGLSGSGSVIVVEHSGDNNIAAFRYKLKDVKMAAAEDDFSVSGHNFRAGSIVIQNADAARIGTALKDLGLSGWAVASAPTVKTHDLDIPRILYLHSWNRTQDEGWVRASLEAYGIPFTYTGDKELANMPNLRQNYDVVIYPHVSGTAQSIVAGVTGGSKPIPYKSTKEFPALGFPDSTDDIRGGMGVQGLMNLYKFVQDGGTLITEGATSTLFPDYNLTPGLTVEQPTALFARGTILRGLIADRKSPLVYGLNAPDMAVYFNQGPVLSTGGGGAGAFGGGRGGGGFGQNTQPMASAPPVSTITIGGVTVTPPPEPGAGRGGGFGGFGGFGGGRGGAGQGAAPRVIMRFPSDTTQMLLSGGLAGGAALSNRAQLVDTPIGNGHVVSFAIRPYWRWQTQGTYILGFNAIMNWNDLDAGKSTTP
ncbi:MAG: hypothetical protein IT356_03080 [Gemmatimonadaceae bacterium]|nr:hypothetical protein [Gemmatimonadaceae bacterium]